MFGNEPQFGRGFEEGQGDDQPPEWVPRGLPGDSPKPRKQLFRPKNRLKELQEQATLNYIHRSNWNVEDWLDKKEKKEYTKLMNKNLKTIEDSIK